MNPVAAMLRRLASLGLRTIDPGAGPAEDSPTPPVKLPADRLRLHLFGATFATQAEADRFCYEPPQPDYPAQLNRELEGAFIDPGQVEVICDDVLPRLHEFLSVDDADDIMLRLGADNSLIIMTELAFGGLPYTLDDTDTLTYLGAIVVDV